MKIDIPRKKVYSDLAEGDVIRQINRIQDIEHVDQKVDSGLNNKLVEATIRFKNKVLPENVINIKELIKTKYGINSKMFVQRFEFIRDGITLKLFF